MLITIGVVAGEMKHRTNDSETMIKIANDQAHGHPIGRRTGPLERSRQVSGRLPNRL